MIASHSTGGQDERCPREEEVEEESGPSAQLSPTRKLNVFNLAAVKWVEEINKPLIGADRLRGLYQGRGRTSLACGHELSTVTRLATLSNHVDGYIPFPRGCLRCLPPQHPINFRSVGARKPPPNGILLLLNRPPERGVHGHLLFIFYTFVILY